MSEGKQVLWLERDLLPLPLVTEHGWRIVYHQFYDVHPDRPVYVGNCPGGDFSELFKSTLLILEHDVRGDVIDVGWGPEADLNGRFYILFYRGGERGEPESEYATREPKAAIALARQLMNS